MRIVSFDVGITNCGVCRMKCEGGSPTVEHLGVMDFRRKCEVAGCSEAMASQGFCKDHCYRQGMTKGLPKPTHSALRSLPRDTLVTMHRALTKREDEGASERQLCTAIHKCWPAARNTSKARAACAPLQDIARGVLRECDALDVLRDVDVVVVENQFSPKANRMLCIQGMLTQYAVMKGISRIVYAAGSAKLSLVPKTHACYSERKTAAVTMATRLGEMLGCPFPVDSKNDDMADALMHALVFAIKEGACRNVVAECLELFPVAA